MAQSGAAGMSTTTDRGAVQLALECATNLRVATLRAGFVKYNAEGNAIEPIADLLADADAMLKWHDERLSERAGRDELKRKAPIPIDMGGV